MTTGAGAGIIGGKGAVTRVSKGPVAADVVAADTDTVLERALDFPLVAGDCKLNVVSTTSSSNFLRFIVLEELGKMKTNGF